MAWTKLLNENRASGVIIKDDKILLIHRIRDDREYWVVPGGSVEEGESVEEALDREIMEELGIRVIEKELLFKIESIGRLEYCFLIKEYMGEPKMGGPELARMDEKNQFILEEREFSKLSEVNLLPREFIAKFAEFLQAQK